ncbi:MAG: tetratricopeptide repeat protein [Patescibacteria group bacterium]|nr:tetratricopeptide repeat protein [Patescibacteria group bacterium]
MFGRIIKSSLYLLVFLLPLFLLPFSFEVYEFSKQYLIFFLVSISLLAWLAKMVFIDKEIRIRRTPLDVLVFVFLLVAVISVIFSVDKGSSLFGFYGRFSNGLISLLSLGTLYFLIVNNTSSIRKSTSAEVSEDRQETGDSEGTPSLLFTPESLLKPFLLSVSFVILIAYFSIFGIWGKIPTTLPQLMLQRTFNTISGSLEGLAVFLSIITVLLVGRILSRDNKKGPGLVFYYLTLAASLILLLIINFNPAWIILLVSLILFLIFAFASRIFRENVNRLLIPIFLIIIATTFLFLDDISQFTGIRLPKEQVLEQGISWGTAFGSATESLKNAFLGSGLGTWHYDFSKFKSGEFNTKPWWQIRFDRSGSHFSEIFATTGFLGILSYSGLILMFFLVSWVFRKNLMVLPYMMTLIALLVGQFVYYQNTVLAFSFWFILGLGVISLQHPTRSLKRISFKDFPEMSLVFSTLLILFSLTVFVGYYFLARDYLADVSYANAQRAPLLEERVALLEKAAILNPKSSTYKIVLARVYLFQLTEEAAKPQAEQDAVKIRDLMAQAIDQSTKAIEISPNSVAAWETQGMIYRDIQFFVQGATEWGIKSFEEAIKLESKNPILYTELGKLYLNLEDFERAKSSFVKAKEVKPDYIDALIQEALVYEREGDLDTAISKIEESVIAYPLNTETKFHLGRLYFNSGRVDEAILQFENIVRLNLNHSNALYSLGIAYTDKGNKEKAISAFEKVLELNPGNQDVINKLEELRKEPTE